MSNFEKASEIAETALSLFSSGMDAEDVISEIGATGISARMVRAAWAKWERTDKIRFSKIDGRVVSAHYIHGK